MTESGAPPAPVLDDLPLTLVHRVEHHLDGGFVATPVVGLAGDVQQRGSRRSHQIRIEGTLAGGADQVRTDLEKLQQLAAAGAEIPFTADIVSALDLQQVVITGFAVREDAGLPAHATYAIELAESPPLPPPAQVSGFGGLDDFGFGDLGFDTDILGDLADIAGEVAGAVDTALGAISALEALSNLGNLSFDGVLAPLDRLGSGLAGIGARVGQAAGELSGVFGS